jgi:hypothetical protein
MNIPFLQEIYLFNVLPQVQYIPDGSVGMRARFDPNRFDVWRFAGVALPLILRSCANRILADC